MIINVLLEFQRSGSNLFAIGIRVMQCSHIGLFSPLQGKTSVWPKLNREVTGDNTINPLRVCLGEVIFQSSHALISFHFGTVSKEGQLKVDKFSQTSSGEAIYQYQLSIGGE